MQEPITLAHVEPSASHVRKSGTDVFRHESEAPTLLRVVSSSNLCAA